MNHKPAKEQIITQAFRFHAEGKIKEAKQYYENFINEGFKDHRVFSNYGMILKNSGKLKEAELFTRKAIEIKPDFAFAYYNLGIIMSNIGNLQEAELFTKKAIEIKTDFVDAYYNLGVILSNIGNLQEAELYIRKAIKIKPDFAVAYSDLGGIFVKLGKLQKAELYIQKAIELDPKNKLIENNLISLLTIYQPKNISSNPLYLINQEFKNLINLKISENTIKDRFAIQIYKDGLEIYKKYNLNLETPNSQIYQRNEINLNCNRHMRIFKKHKIIPEFCFGCYKVQVKVDSIIELIKLFLVFNKLELENSNTRKCMVESRSNVSGFYKGLIYCSGLNEALEISKKLNVIIQNSIRVDLISEVKRGCSEYPLEFPKYKEINISGDQPMNYNEEWRNLENEIDKGNKDWGKSNKSIEGFNLKNFLIMRNWVAYAQNIGDKSVNMITKEQIKGPKKFNYLNRDFISKKAQKKEHEIKKHPIPSNSDSIQGNLNINKNSISKEKIIVQACNLHKQGKIKEAKKYYENFINQGLKDHRIFSNYGLILMHSGKVEEGEIYLRKSIKLNPNLSETHHNLGIILINSGKLEEGEISLHKAFEINPNLTCVSYSLSKLKHKDNKKNKAWKQKLFSNNFLNNKSQYDQINIYFSRANILHENKSYSESAKYFKLANKLKLDLKPSNADRLIKKSKNLLTESEKTELNNKECSRFPESIFIVGMPRSGTTLLESILSMNNNVKDLGEINILEKSFLESKRINNDVKFADLYWREISKHKGKLNITTNKWLYNYQYVGIICNQIPNAKIIHCYRNPLDNILSIYRSKFANGHGYSSSLIDCTKVYLDQEKLMTKYKNTFRSKIYDFNYDSLVINTNQQIKELITWLDWKWENKYLVPHLNKRAVSTASNIQVRAPINANSINGWKNYKNMLKPAIEVLSKTERYRKLV